MKFTNPIIRGFYPDPSICYANGSYYIVCSSFQYFPGLPLFKSENMTDWELIGHCLTRKSQLDLTNVKASGGLYAPTIRYNKGRFYVVVTNTSGNGNFYVYTDDINGEWSEPILVDRSGIDPSLLFDEDKVYFMSNGSDDFGKLGISICEINIDTGEILTKSRCISQGTGGRFIEAPHLYHIGEYYYLLVAEGGTEYGHMECILRSKDIYGPYESYKNNPILSNKNLGGYFIQGSGHADIIEDESGQWWMVNLAFRQINNWKQFHHLGREVFLEPIFWTKDNWITVGTDGTSRASYEVENKKCEMKIDAKYPIFKWKVNPNEACYVRSPNYNNYKFISENEFYLKGSSNELNSKGNVTFLGMRQKEFDCIASVKIEIKTIKNGQKAGITVYMDEKSHYDLYLEKENDSCKVICEFYVGSMKIPMKDLIINEPEIELKIEGSAEEYNFYVKNTDNNFLKIGSGETKFLSSEVAEGFTGVIIAAFCVFDNENENNFVKFKLNN